MPIIEIDNISKRYRTERGGRALVGRGGILSRPSPASDAKVSALQDISFDVDPGEALGIIGANGSGKSTLLKIIAGVTVPTTGTVSVHGRVTSLLELGAGFHPMLTGRENVYLNAGIHGMRKPQVDAAFDSIVEFSGIGDSIDYPVDTYSSGMYVRIAFAVAVHVNPDVFLIDEVLSVGDEAFQRKCRTRIGELMEQGKTIVFVSHDLGIVNTLCDRVILLSGGRLIARDTAANAINFYLRQVGAERGVHTFRDGPLEAVLCDGRLSLFYNEREVTSAAGFQYEALNLGQWHKSIHAEWSIEQADETGCIARGRLSRLPVSFVWRLRMKDGRLDWRFEIDCEREIDIDGLALSGKFPVSYRRWAYDDETGDFPDIRPDDTTDTVMTYPELLCENARLESGDDTESPSVVMELSSSRANVTGYWANTGFLEASRHLRIEEHHASLSGPFTKGTHEVLNLSGSLVTGKPPLAGQASRYTVKSGELLARFDRGRIRLNYAGRQITTNLHMYASMRIGNLWTDSTSMLWSSFTRDGDTLRFGGVSRRFPYEQTWELRPVPGGIGLTIWIDFSAPLAIQEYQTSVVLVSDYEHWSTDHEYGDFPEFNATASDWTHLNTNYAVGKGATATGEGLPDVSVESDIDRVPTRMTVINTTPQQRGRVLQALRTAEQDEISFDPGHYLYFSGKVTFA